MFCSRCGANIPEGSRNCPSCGSPLSASSSTPSPSATPQQQMAPQGAMPPAPSLAQPPTDGKATASLILGILSVFCLGFLTGIPAVILGHMSRSAIRESRGRLKGEGMALAGLIMGYLGSVSLIIFVIAAIAIPNLIQARVKANEANAASSLCIINTAQVTYAAKYSTPGYAHDLTELTSGQRGTCVGGGTADHPCTLDELACSSTWCRKAGYDFSVTGTDCEQSRGCAGYVVVAVPVSSNMGRRSFCSTQDLVVRYERGGSIIDAPTAAVCQLWPPL